MFFVGVNLIVFSICVIGILFNPRNFLVLLMDVELMLLSSNLNVIHFSIYLDDLYDQLFSLLILTIAASESAVGLAIIIIYYHASLRQTDSQKSDTNSNQSTDSIADPDNEGGESEEDKKKKKALPRVLTKEEVEEIRVNDFNRRWSGTRKYILIGFGTCLVMAILDYYLKGL